MLANALSDLSILGMDNALNIAVRNKLYVPLGLLDQSLAFLLKPSSIS